MARWPLRAGTGPNQCHYFLSGDLQHRQNGYKTFLGELSVRGSKVPLEARLRAVILPSCTWSVLHGYVCLVVVGICK